MAYAHWTQSTATTEHGTSASAIQASYSIHELLLSHT